ncbi:MAG: hypothetical protein EOM19_02250 [Candidatus Moranbacteria bacterium]|nr:hypothetical protein [Candidatus Moranbacteria bacterium]
MHVDDFEKALHIKKHLLLMEEKLGTRVQLAENVFATCLRYSGDLLWKVFFYFDGKKIRVRFPQEMSLRMRSFVLNGAIITGYIGSSVDETFSFVYRKSNPSTNWDVFPTSHNAKQLLLNVDGSEINWFSSPIFIDFQWT